MGRKRKAQSEPTIELSHRIELMPDDGQAAYFGRACGTARFTWNWALAEWNRQFDAGLKPTAMTLKKEFNAIKYRDFPWLRDIHRDAHAEPFSNLAKAWAKFFKDCKNGKPPYAPAFKKKGKCRDSFYVANDKCKVNGKEITLPMAGKVRMTEELRFKGSKLGCVVSRCADRWFVSIQVAVPAVAAMRQRTADNVEGVDLGISSAVALSTGEKIEAPKPLKRMLRRLKIRQRRLSRKLEAAKLKAGIEKGKAIPKGTRLEVSKNRLKDTLGLQKTHLRISNVRKDFTHKTTTRLCRENAVLCLESLNVSCMLKNHKLALALSDVGIGEVLRQIRYKSALCSTQIVEADRWFPSSKTCHLCGFVHAGLKLSDRIWTCPDCGTRHDRDVNAARNLKQLATVKTALPVASPSVTQDADVSGVPGMVGSAGKVTPVSDDSVLKKDQGGKRKEAEVLYTLSSTF